MNNTAAATRHVVTLARIPGGTKATCRCGWTAAHPARIGALAAGNHHKNETYIASQEQNSHED